MTQHPAVHSLDVLETLSKLTLDEKIDLLAAKSDWQTFPIPRLDIPSVRVSDGPNGVRGQFFFNGTPSSCFPCSTGLAASFDVSLSEEVGRALGDECIAKGAHVLLAPTVNTARSPLGGRGFESFSEDPVLNGTMAAHYIIGVQSKKVVATIKHFVCNDQEFERMSIDAVLSQRALREIYLRPFEIAMRLAQPKAIMTSYNRMNGLHCSEDKDLIEGILREEWGFEGIVISDWTGTYSTAEAILAGLDLEFPGPTIMRGAAVHRMLTAKKLTEKDIDDRVIKILELVKTAQLGQIPFDAPESSIDTPYLRGLLRRAASSAIVVLKNNPVSSTSTSLLPIDLKNIKKLAVIGPNSKPCFTSGGGSAELLSTYRVSPLEGIKEAASEAGVEVLYSVGSQSYRFLPLIEEMCKLPAKGEKGSRISFFNEQPKLWKGEEATWGVDTQMGYMFFTDHISDDVNFKCWAQMDTIFVPDQSGDWEFGLVLEGQGDLYLDGERILVNSILEDQVRGELFMGQGTIEVRATVPNLIAGKEYKLEVRMSNHHPVGDVGSPFISRGAIRLGGWRITSEQQAIDDAVKVAKEADAAVVVVGLSYDWESEGFDRTTLDLPGTSNALVSAVLAANPNTIIVNQSGTPVEFPWIERAPAVVQAFYGGNFLGEGLADVLFGKVNPSGKLPLSWPKKLEDNPSYISFGKGENGKVLYNEGIYVGYKNPSFKPLFPFGHGLSYSNFTYSGLSIPAEISTDGELEISFGIQNDSSIDGQEIVQIYVADPSSSDARPEKELKSFVKINLKAGEKKQVKVSLDKTSWSYWSESANSWIAEKGTFSIIVAGSSIDWKLVGETKLPETFKWIGL